MAKVLFVQDTFYEHHGTEVLSAVLKSAGHECAMLILTGERGDPIDRIRSIRPDIVAFSIMTIRVEWATRLARRVKEELGIRNIFGGPHPTFFPDDLMRTEAVDMVCVGEGEGALLELAASIDRGWEGHEHIQNLQVRTNGDIIVNPVRPLVGRLDELPFQDRGIYFDRYPLIGKLPKKRFLVGRGCPYDCSFCSNHSYRRLYRGKGKYCRKRSQEAVIAEIKDVRDRYGVTYASFTDDTFTTDKRYLYEFLELYRIEIGLPFNCLTRADEIDEETVAALKRAGCHSIAFGLETANEKTRETILRKRITDEQIERAAALFKQYGIVITTYNMIGLPTETLEDALATLKMNARIGTDVPVAQIFRPLPGTDILEHLDADRQALIMKELTNLEQLFAFGVMCPWAIPVIERLIKWPNNHLFQLVRLAVMSYTTMKRSNIGIFMMVRMGLKVRNMA
jgi:radical SAM superfamily enzyme YgiQ (UPF0313 family)